MLNLNLIGACRTVADTIVAYIKCFKIFLPPRRRITKPAKKHLLLLTWAFPPDVTGGVYRPISIVHGAKKRGWRVTVLCGYSSGNASAAGNYLEKNLVDAAKIIRLHRPILQPSYKLFIPKIDGGFVNLLETIELACKVLADDQPSLILASGPTFHNFVAAREISKRFGKPYVLDYRDEWTECPFDIVKVGNVDRYFEKKCIRDASKVIFTTESHLQHQESCFKIPDEGKTAVIPNGWEVEDSPTESTVNPLGTAEVRIAFVGFLSEHTFPRQFLRSLERCLEASPELLTRLRIGFVGSKSVSALEELRQFKFQNLIDSIDVVPKPVALKIMQDADGLILINEPRLHRYRPGKLYDYVSMKTPILVYGGGGEVEDVVTKLQVGVVIRSDDHEELRTALLDLKAVKIGCRSAEVDMWLSKHTRSALAEKMMDLLDGVENLG